MTEEEIAERLRQLREHYGLTDEDVLSQATQGTLSPEPEFVEWLILLGRGDLA